MPFKPGQPKPPTAGRKKGTPNKVTVNLREAILQSFDQVGGVEYLVTQARKNPKAYMGLLAKVVPTEITGPGGSALHMAAPAITVVFTETAEPDEIGD